MSWFSNLLETIRDFFPRVFIIFPDEGGVRITLGTKVKRLSPGWYIYWPVIQEAYKVTVTPQPIDLRPQSVLTKDRDNVSISGGVLYKISDAKKALLHVQDFDRSIQTFCMGVITEYVGKKKFSELEVGQIRDQILTSLREEASGFGLKIMRVYITDIGKCMNLRLLGREED